jgi:transposase
MKKKNSGGRPRGSVKLNVEIIANLQQYLLDGHLIKDACSMAGVSYPSFYRWRNLGKMKKRGIYRAFHQAISPIFEEKERRWREYCQQETEKAFARLEKQNARIQRYLAR